MNSTSQNSHALVNGLKVLVEDDAYIFEVLSVVYSTDDHVEIYVKRLGELDDLLENRFGDLSQDVLETWAGL